MGRRRSVPPLSGEKGEGSTSGWEVGIRIRRVRGTDIGGGGFLLVY
jgi:hypothetical protein